MIESVMPLLGLKEKLPKPKITFDRFGQLSFTVREVLKIAFKVKPRLIIVVLVINSIFGVSSVAIFYLEKLIIDRLIAAIGIGDLVPVVISISILVSIGIVLTFVRNILGSVSGFLSRNLARYFDIASDLMLSEKLAQLDMETLEDPEFRDKLSKIERESGMRAWQLINPLSNMPSYFFGFLSAAVVLLYIHPAVSLVVIFLSIPRVLVNQKYIKKRYKLQSDLSEKYRIWDWLRQYLIRSRNFLELKILNISGYLSKKLDKVATYSVDSLFDLGKKQTTSRIWTFIPGLLFEFFVSVILIYWVILRRITVGSFQLYLRSLRSIQENISSFVTDLLSIYENYIYVADLVWLLELEPKIKDTKDLKEPGKNLSIEFDKVWFKYKKDSAWVLKDIDLKIKEGEKVALVGENGVGKSTLIKLLARFYDPDKGKVLVGSTSLTKIKPRAWQDKLAILFQQFETYPFSVEETVAYGDIKRIKDKKEIKEVINKVGLKDYIESLPLKYKNPLSARFDKGAEPSIGQWQRLGIARMLFRKQAQVIIMDEPTSNVDPKAEEKIFNELLKKTKDKTLVFVSQRFSTVRHADKILVMDKGKIVERGTHGELMKKDGLYAELFKIQAKGYQ